MRKIMKNIRDIFSPIAIKVFPVQWKELNEIYYWKQKKREEKTLTNNHYEYFYTKYFSLTEEFYSGKVILDIGCGPRGSLEWADMASRRLGLDPLANEYRKIGADKHKMTYIDAPSEKIPLENCECDVVCSFNSLDHVYDVKQTIKEIKRVTKGGGVFLLIVEVNHQASDTEPHSLSPKKIIEMVGPEFKLQSINVYYPKGNDIYGSILRDQKYSNPIEVSDRGFLTAEFWKCS